VQFGRDGQPGNSPLSVFPASNWSLILIVRAVIPASAFIHCYFFFLFWVICRSFARVIAITRIIDYRCKDEKEIGAWGRDLVGAIRKIFNPYFCESWSWQ
jgi:uncharacterized membrane protein